MYIPVCPLTVGNVDYLARQRETFISGHPAPDFPGGKGESEHRGRPLADYLGSHSDIDGRRAMGLASFDGGSSSISEASILKKANAALGVH